VPPQAPTYYVSITGLRLTSVAYAPLFWFHAMRSMTQVRAATGLISVDARTIQGVHHTRTVWTDRRAMINYLESGAHARAMAIYPTLATGKVLGVRRCEIPARSATRLPVEGEGRSV